MPAATTLLILQKDGKKRADGLVPLYSMGKSPPTTWKKFYLPRSLLGGISKGKDQHWQLHYTISQHFQAVKAFQHLEHQETSKHWSLYRNDVSGHKPADIPAPQSPGGVEVLPTRSSAGRAQSARRARSSCSRQLPVGSIVSTFTQVPGLEETGRSKKTKEQRCLNSSANILSHLDKRHARKTSIIGVQLLLQNSHDYSMHTHIQHRSVQPVSRARRGCMHCCLSSNLHLIPYAGISTEGNKVVTSIMQAQLALWNPCQQLQWRTMDQAALIPVEAAHTLPSPTTSRADSVT